MKKALPFFLVSVLLFLSSCVAGNGAQLYYDYDLTEYITVGDFSKTVDRESDDYKKYYRQFYFDYFGEDFAYNLDSGEVQEGDKININYFGTYNGEEFDGGSELNYSIRVGDELFTVEGFEKGLIGIPLGGERTLELTLPDSYHNKELAGKEVTYLVSVNSITRYPEPSDAQAVEYGFASYDDYHKQADEFAIGVCVFNSAYDCMEIKAYPEKETEILVDELYAEYAASYAENGMSVQAYVASVDWTMEQFNDHLYDSIQKDFRRMPRDLLSYYILHVHDSKLTLKEIEDYRDGLGEDFQDVSDIQLERMAVYSKALRVCCDIAEVK